MRHVKWISPVIAVGIIVLTLIYWQCKDLNESETGTAFQAGATLALVALTWGYLSATSSSVEATREVLQQAKQSYIMSIRPIVTMRYFTNKADGFEVFSTWLVNTGNGTACEITLYWNVQEFEREGAYCISADLDRQGMLHSSPFNRDALGFPLIPDNGSAELRIFLNSSTESGISTPLHIPGMRALLVYKDIEGNPYFTRIQHNTQIPGTGELELENEDVKVP